MSCLRSERLLDAIEAHFRDSSLASALVLDVAAGQARQGEPLRLGRARDLVLDRSADPAFKDAVWAEIVELAQQRGERWQLAAVWMMIPGLRKILGRLCRGAASDFREIEAEIVAGFLEALRKADAGAARLGSALWWAAYRRGFQIRSQLLRETPSEELALGAARREGQDHEIRPLADAVHEGVLSVTEADLINRTRLEGERLGAVAERMGLRYHACHQRRARAEGRLAGYLLIEGEEGSSTAQARGAGVGRLDGEGDAA